MGSKVPRSSCVVSEWTWLHYASLVIGTPCHHYIKLQFLVLGSVFSLWKDSICFLSIQSFSKCNKCRYFHRSHCRSVPHIPRRPSFTNLSYPMNPSKKAPSMIMERLSRKNWLGRHRICLRTFTCDTSSRFGSKILLVWPKKLSHNCILQNKMGLPPTYTEGFHTKESIQGITYRQLGKTDLMVTWKKSFGSKKTSICERCQASVLVPPPWEGSSRQPMTMNRPAWSSGCCNRGSTTLTPLPGEIVETNLICPF